MIKGSIQQEDISFVNIYAPNIYKANINTPKGRNRKQYNNCRGDFSTSLISIDTSSRQKINFKNQP